MPSDRPASDHPAPEAAEDPDGPLAPHRIAGLVAPAVDRVFVGAMAATREHGGVELSRRYGGPDAVGFLIEFRTRLATPGGAVTSAGLAAVARYRDPTTYRRGLDKNLAHGTVIRRGEDFLATARGLAFLDELFTLHGQVTTELWTAHPERIARLVETLGRLLEAAAADGGDAFTVMAPPHEPDGTPPGVLLLNRLGTLRYHRADAHAAAWAAAGHTARTVEQLPAGPERLAIERETDRRAAGPYRVLTAAERLSFLADLAALPA